MPSIDNLPYVPTFMIKTDDPEHPWQSVPAFQGEKGDNGRGIQSIKLDSDGNFVILYTDNSSETIIKPKEVTM